MYNLVCSEIQKTVNQNPTLIKDVAYYMALPYSIRLIPDPDGTWFAEVIELKGCMTVGDTQIEALTMLEDAQLTWISGALKAGDPIPEPFSHK